MRSEELRASADLDRGEIEVLGLLPAASNYTLLARLSVRGAGAEDAPLVVYKPRRGEAPLWDFPPGTLCRREVAAYLVSEAAGWGFVPPTTFRNGPLGVGAVQLFIDHDWEVTAFELLDERPHDLKRIAAYDLVVNNADRKAGHVFLDEAGRMWAVDHGICFHAHPKLRTVLWDFVGEPIPEEDLASLRRLQGALAGDLRSRLGELLAPEEVEALEIRVDTNLVRATFPPPGPGRSYPWPPV